MKDLPVTIPGIERWITAVGGRKVTPRERAALKKHGLLDLPRE